jgi:hypothetical protein
MVLAARFHASHPEKPTKNNQTEQTNNMKRTTTQTISLIHLLSSLTAVLLVSPLASADTIAEWTFETSLPAGTPGAGVWITNIAAEVGSGVAAGLHAGNATYSTPVGNGSAHSFSSTAWAMGDCYQFAVNTLGFQNVTVAYDQTGSGTGPRDFRFSFSTDGVNFTPVGPSYIVLTNNASANNEGSGKSTSAWSSTGSQQSVYTFTFDLSSTNSLANQPVVYFRLTVADGTAENGGSIGSAGTDRVDNFLVSGAPLASVTPPWLNIQLAGTNVVLTWTNALFNLQSAPETGGVYTNIPDAVSPYTNSVGDPQKFYRLVH